MIVSLASEFGWSMQDVGNLTLAQVSIIGQWMSKRRAEREKQERVSKARARAKTSRLRR